ncbi:MAG TPA: CPBP family intramembrane glutamic endopeptidase [Acidobacteriaceae bacterium]|jgi:hypothetical protein|nr:CPBP family intramembrane glutamic endopeptidase [Acidobacteriaceae bacterium]
MLAMFFGPHGLRAGWAVLLFAALWWVFNFAAEFLTAPLLHQDWEAPLRAPTVTLIEVWQLFGVVAATGLMAFFERRPPLSYGFQGRARAVRFVSGLAWGFAAISALVLALRGLGFLTLNRGGPGSPWSWKEAAAWGVVFLLTGFAEEAMFRGYAQFTLARGMGFWWGALLCSAAFGLMHRANGGESTVGVLAAAAIGLIFCLSLWYTGSLWWAVGFHAAWDWGESYFYGVADSGMVTQGHLLRAHAAGPIAWSGGSVGPEGSVLIWPVLAVIAVAMAVWWGKRGDTPLAEKARQAARIPLHPIP